MVEPWDQARALIEGANLGVPIEWPNEGRPPLDPDANGYRPTWLQVDMAPENLAPIEMGPNGAYQEEGYLVVRIFTPRNAGSRDARILAKTIANLFRGLPSGPVIWTRSSLSEGSAQDPDGAHVTDGMWWLMTLHLDYRYQDIVSA